MVFPEKLVVRTMEASTGIEAPRIALIVTFFAQKKNNYHLPIVSSEKGLAVISREMARAHVLQTRDHFAMDYSSDLEDCLPEVLIRNCPAEEVQRMLTTMERNRKYYDIPQSLIDDFRKSQNHLFDPQEVRVILDTPAPERVVDLLIQRRAV